MSDQRYKKPEDRIISFGKHIGKKYSEVSTDYLLWFYRRHYHQMKNRALWAFEELQRRGVKICF